MNVRTRRRSLARSLGRKALVGTVILTSGCVHWQSVPVGDVGSRPLPRWVQVTTRDSVHYTLEGARLLPGDTLVGRAAEAGEGAPAVRLARGEIAHMEARVPSGPGSLGVGALVIGGVVALVALVGHASTW